MQRAYVRFVDERLFRGAVGPASLFGLEATDLADLVAPTQADCAPLPNKRVRAEGQSATACPFPTCPQRATAVDPQ